MEGQNTEGLVPLPVLHGSSRRGSLAGAGAVLLVHYWCHVMGRRVRHGSFVIRKRRSAGALLVLLVPDGRRSDGRG